MNFRILLAIGGTSWLLMRYSHRMTTPYRWVLFIAAIVVAFWWTAFAQSDEKK